MTEHTDEPVETPEPTAEQRRAELPGLGYTGKFDHGDVADEDPADEDTEDGEQAPEPSPSPATTEQAAPPPAAQPWTLGRHTAGE